MEVIVAPLHLLTLIELDHEMVLPSDYSAAIDQNFTVFNKGLNGAKVRPASDAIHDQTVTKINFRSFLTTIVFGQIENSIKKRCDYCSTFIMQIIDLQ